MSVAVQRIVDRIADELHRPALLEDRFERLIAYSTHYEPTDEVRSETILRRQAAPQVVDWLNRRGLPAARSPMRVPGNDELGMLPRICFPIRDHGQLLAYLWFVEANKRFSAQETLRASHAASELCLALNEETPPSHPGSAQVIGALRRLLVDGRETGAAVRRLIDGGYFRPTDDVVAVVITPLCDGDPDPATLDRAVSYALDRVWQAVPPSKALQLRRPDHGVLLLPIADGDQFTLKGRLSAIGDTVRAAAQRVTGLDRMLVGVGGRRPGLLAAADSYREARLAARVGLAGLALADPTSADSVMGAEVVVQWADLGIYQVVAELADESDPPRVIHPGLRGLIGDPEAQPLVETLETYLDLAGNAQLAAQRLNLHRASLYYRLQRLEQLAGTSLRDGRQRLALHLELKLARLTGEHAPMAERPSHLQRRPPA